MRIDLALKKKQITFCKEYVKDYNGTQAAIRAGYKESNVASQASRLLSNPEIIEEIKNQQKQLLEVSCLTEEKVINQLEEVIDRCLSKKPVMEWNYEEHCMVETGQWNFDSKGALKAIELLGKHLGMFGKSDGNVHLTINSEDFVNALDGKATEVWTDEE